MSKVRGTLARDRWLLCSETLAAIKFLLTEDESSGDFR